jgi:NADP-dependent 3-hydroxy acid dehydrogenase YdfG
MKKALVTGATAGIGWAVAERLTTDGYEVWAVGRRRERLEELKRKIGCHICPSDVTDNDAMRDFIDDCQPDALINNAGIGMAISGLEGVAEEDVARAIAVNVTAPIQIARLAIPHMRKRGQGHIVNLGSIAGLHTLVSALYGAGKSAIHRFSQNLRYELVGSGIRVSEICPGRVDTEFYDPSTGNIEANQLGSVPFQALDPKDVADCVAFALLAPLHVNISTIELLPSAQAVGGVKAGAPK